MRDFHQSHASYNSTNLIETLHSYADTFVRLYKMATIIVVLHCSVGVETVGQGHRASDIKFQLESFCSYCYQWMPLILNHPY